MYLSHWLSVLRHPAREFAGSGVEPEFGAKMMLSRDLTLTNIPWDMKFSQSIGLNSVLPPEELRSDAWLG